MRCARCPRSCGTARPVAAITATVSVATSAGPGRDRRGQVLLREAGAGDRVWRSAGGQAGPENVSGPARPKTMANVTARGPLRNGLNRAFSTRDRTSPVSRSAPCVKRIRNLASPGALTGSAALHRSVYADEIRLMTRETNVLSRLRHENVVVFHAAFESPASMILVTEIGAAPPAARVRARARTHAPSTHTHSTRTRARTHARTEFKSGEMPDGEPMLPLATPTPRTSPLPTPRPLLNCTPGAPKLGAFWEKDPLCTIVPLTPPPGPILCRLGPPELLYSGRPCTDVQVQQSMHELKLSIHA